MTFNHHLRFNLHRPALAGSAVLLLTASACSSDEPTEQAQTSPSAVASSSSAPPSPSASRSALPSSAAPAPDAPNTINVAFASGQVTGDTGRVQVPLGENVTINLTSDVADEAHLHGYDVSEPIPAGGTATLTFTASIPGVFELELEELGEQLLSLQVS